MKKTTLLLSLLISSTAFSQSHLYLKGNALFAPVGIINIGAEQQISRKTTIQVDGFLSPWKSFLGKNLTIGMLGMDFRYYFKEAFKHFYIGANVSAATYNMQKWNYWNDEYFQLSPESPVYIKSNLYQKGYSIMFGATVGYQFQINQKWNLDLYVGGGNSQDFYKGYDKITGNRYDTEDPNKKWNRSGEIIPYRGGLMISYQIK